MRKRISAIIILSFFAVSFITAAPESGVSGVVHSATNTVLLYLGSVFDNLFVLFTRQLNLSFANLRDNIVPQLCFILILCEVSWLSIQAILRKSMAIPEVMMKLFLVVLVVVITQNLNWIVNGLMKLFTAMAKTAGDSANLYTGDAAIFTPSIVIQSTGMMLSPLAEARESLTNFMDGIEFGFFKDNTYALFSLLIPALVAKGVLWLVEIMLLVMICFCNINVTMWLIEFQFLMVVCMICLPWHIFAPTRFIASGIWQALFGQAIKLFVIVFLVSIAPNLFQTVTATATNSLLNALLETQAGFSFAAVGGLAITVIGVCIAYCYFLLKGPAIAKAIIVGQPVMETLGSHTVAMMGARALGLVGAGFGAAAAGASGLFGSAAGSLFGWMRHPFGGSESSGSHDTNYNQGKV